MAASWCVYCILVLPILNGELELDPGILIRSPKKNNTTVGVE